MKASDFVALLREALPAVKLPAPLHEPEFAGQEWKYLKDCLDTGWVSSVGSYVDRFEKDLAAVCGVKRAVAVVNGTAALHVAQVLCGVKPGDEVLVPCLTFVATANSVVLGGAVPHFVDVESRTLGVDAEKLRIHLASIGEKRSGALINRRTGKRIAALIVMHCFGHPAELSALVTVAREFGVPLVEDAAEGIGSFYHGKHVGGFGQVATLSFNGNKIITTGGGGAVLTNDEELGSLAKHLTTTAKRPHQWEFFHDQVGFNYRLPNLNAALGCAQLEQLDSFLARKRRLADAYRRHFASVPWADFLDEPPNCSSNFWLCTILLGREMADERDSLLLTANQAGFGLRPVWKLMHHLPMYEHCFRGDLSQAEDLERRVINLPSSARLGDGCHRG